MQIEYEISEQDFLDAQKLAVRNAPNLTTRLLLRVLPFWGVFVFPVLPGLYSSRGLRGRRR
jgi:hypothetical protein